MVDWRKERRAMRAMLFWREEDPWQLALAVLARVGGAEARRTYACIPIHTHARMYMYVYMYICMYRE